MKDGTVDYTVLGVDIGGSHVTAAVMDIDKGAVLPGTLVRKHVDSAGTAEEILQAWVEAISGARSRRPGKEVRVGIAMPGPFDYENGVSLIRNMNKFEALYKLDIRRGLSCKLEVQGSHIRFRNDAEAFLAGEVLGGAGKGYATVFGITLGTGLGSALYKQGCSRDLNLGSSLFLGGIAEDYLSTRWFLQAYADRTGARLGNVKELSALAGDDPRARQVMEEFGRNLGAFLVSVIDQEAPEAVVIGGNISRAHHFFLPEVMATLEEHHLATPIRIACMGEAAALLGATSCWQSLGITP